MADEKATAPRERGLVKMYNKAKGFGFIIPASGGRDVFVHVSKLSSGVRELARGQRVEYSPGPGRDNRPAASDVIVVS